MFVCVCVYLEACVSVYVCLYVYLEVCVCVCVCVCLCVRRVCVSVFMDYSINYNVYNDSERDDQSLIRTLMTMIREVLVLINVV